MTEAWTVLKVLGWTQGRFAEADIATARLDAELLLARVLGYDRVGLYTHFDQPLGPEELAAYRALIKRRLGGEPIAYLIGRREFRSLEFEVDSRVLVPRPETEILVEAALAHLGPLPDEDLATPPRAVDVGTGSGAIAIALKAERPDLQMIAIDRSPEAAQVARANAERLGVAIVVREGDLLAPVEGEGALDLIVSNPPYIPTGELATLPPEVKREPRAALDGGRDGLDIIRRLVQAAPRALKVGGALALEVGAGQAQKVAALFADEGFSSIAIRRDLAGIERVVFGLRTTSAT
jgi:release factor glutamine methyltransferase